MADVLYTPKSKKCVDSVLLAEIGVDDEHELVEINPLGEIKLPLLGEIVQKSPEELSEILLDLPIELWLKLDQDAQTKQISIEEFLIQLVNDYIEKNQ